MAAMPHALSTLELWQNTGVCSACGAPTAYDMGSIDLRRLYYNLDLFFSRVNTFVRNH